MAAVELVTAYISLVPTLQGVQGKVAELMGGEGEQAGRKFNAGMAVGMGAAIAVIAAAAAGIGKVVSTGFGEAREAESLNAQLTAGIKSTGNAANVSVGELNALASSIQSYSGQTDDSIAATQSLLLRFTSIKNVGVNKIFDDATIAAADMAARLGGDAASQAQKLGRALEDPIAGTQLLARSGVVFTDQQKEQIATLQESGDLLGAQRMILDQVAVAYGGSAAAAGATFDGSLQRIKRSFEDVSQVVVQGALPLLTPILNSIATALQGMAPAAERVGGVLSSGLGKAIDFIGPAFKELWATLGPLAQQFLQLWTTVSPLSVIFKAIQPYLPMLLAAFKQLASTVGGALGNALQTLMPALSQLAGVLAGILVQALAIIIPIIVQLVDILGPIFSQVLVALLPVITTLADVLGQLLTAFLPLLTPILGLLPPLAELIASILPPVIKLFAALLVPILELISPLLDLLIPILGFVIDVLGAVVGGVVEAITWFVNLVTGSEEASNQLATVWESVLKFFDGIWKGIVGFFADGISKAIAFVTGLPGKVLEALGNLGSLLFNSGKDLIQGLIDGAGSLLKNIGKFFLDMLPSWIVDPFKSAMGIKSPSRVMAGLGVEIPRGLVVGIESEQSLVERSMASLLAPTSPSLFASGFSTDAVDASDSTAFVAPGDSSVDLSDRTIDKLARALAQAIAQLNRILDRMGVA